MASPEPHPCVNCVNQILQGFRPEKSEQNKLQFPFTINKYIRLAIGSIPILIVGN